MITRTECQVKYETIVNFIRTIMGLGIIADYSIDYTDVERYMKRCGMWYED